MTGPANPPNLNVASPTVWGRFFCSARDPSLSLGQQVQVRDALFFLARQWQVGELTGFDGASPVDAAYNLEQSPISAYEPFNGVAAEQVTPAGAPLEVRAERETIALGLRGSIQLGLRFEAMVTATTAAKATPSAEDIISLFRATFPIPATPPLDEIYDPAAVALHALSANRVTDGWQLYQAISGQTLTAVPLLAAQAVSMFTTYCNGLYSQPNNDGAWNVADLRFEFETTVSLPGGPSVVLQTDDYLGGQLDWYDFDYSASPAGDFVTSPTAASVIPHHIWFPGMPTNKWWEFEDGATDLGGFDTQLVDLTKMLLAEFAAVCANDWFEFTIPVPLGTLNRLAALVVTDTFGVRTLIPPTSQLDQPGAPGKVWRMFTLSGDDTRRDTLLLPPVLARVQDGGALENVVFTRDDMAAMCWGVEDTLMGPLDNARSGYEAQLGPTPSPSPPPSSSTAPSVADVNYLIGTTVPANWIPLLPFTAQGLTNVASAETLNFRRGAMVGANPAGAPILIRPLGAILQPSPMEIVKPQASSMLIIRDQAIPRAGLQVNRYFRRARWTDGSIYCWMARRVKPGTKYGSSGLAFDSLEPPGT